MQNYIGRPIRSLQTMLHHLAAYNPHLTVVIPDGIYGPATKTAVESFQREFGIPITGVADLETWEAIVAEHDRHEIINGPVYPLHLYFQPGQTIIPGEENLHMYVINSILQVLSLQYNSMPMAESGGIHTEAGVDAIKWLQAMAQLEQTGHIDRHTWRALAALYRATTGDGTGKKG